MGREWDEALWYKKALLERQESRTTLDLGGDDIENEINNSVGKKRNHKADKGVEDGVLSVGNFLGIASGEGVFDTAKNQHNNRENAEDVKDGIGDAGENTIGTEKIGRHFVGLGGLDTLADRESHDFTSKKGGASGSAGEDL